MKFILASAALLFACALNAQAPTPAPLAQGGQPGEPHHHLKIENEYVRAYYVEVPAHEETQLHQHDHDYLFVTLGDSDVMNAVLNKPEVHLLLKDGETHFTRGGFAHVARNLSDKPFRNVTIELLDPQENPQNLCRQVIAGPVSVCLGSPVTRFKDFPDQGLPVFRTDEIRVRELDIPTTPTGVDFAGGQATLVVSLGSAYQKLRVSGKPEIGFGAGEVAWLPAGQKYSIVAERDGHIDFIEVTFADSNRRLDH